MLRRSSKQKVKPIRPSCASKSVLSEGWPNKQEHFNRRFQTESYEKGYERETVLAGTRKVNRNPHTEKASIFAAG